MLFMLFFTSSPVVKMVVCSRGCELRTRHREHGAIGVEREENREGVFPPYLTMGLVGASWLKANLVHFISHRTYLVKGKFSLSIGNGSDTFTILRIS